MSLTLHLSIVVLEILLGSQLFESGDFLRRRRRTIFWKFDSFLSMSSNRQVYWRTKDCSESPSLQRSCHSLCHVSRAVPNIFFPLLLTTIFSASVNSNLLVSNLMPLQPCPRSLLCLAYATRAPSDLRLLVTISWRLSRWGCRSQYCHFEWPPWGRKACYHTALLSASPALARSFQNFYHALSVAWHTWLVRAQTIASSPISETLLDRYQLWPSCLPQLQTLLLLPLSHPWPFLAATCYSLTDTELRRVRSPLAFSHHASYSACCCTWVYSFAPSVSRLTSQIFCHSLCHTTWVALSTLFNPLATIFDTVCFFPLQIYNLQGRDLQTFCISWCCPHWFSLTLPWWFRLCRSTPASLVPSTPSPPSPPRSTSTTNIFAF